MPKNTHIVVHRVPSSELPDDTDTTFYSRTEAPGIQRTDFYCAEDSPRAAREAVFNLIMHIRRTELGL